jgi:hypothetical protein
MSTNKPENTNPTNHQLGHKSDHHGSKGHNGSSGLIRGVPTAVEVRADAPLGDAPNGTPHNGSDPNGSSAAPVPVNVPATPDNTVLTYEDLKTCIGPLDRSVSFPGFTSKEITEFDLQFRDSFGIYHRTQAYDKNQPGPREWLVLDPEGIKQVRKFIFWKERGLPPNELDGAKFADRMYGFIVSQGGKFLRDELGGYHILIRGRRIPIDATTDEMKAFLLDTCKITSLSVASEMAVERLRNEAYRAASKMTFRRFSAMYDTERVYLPVADGKILLVTPGEILLVPNGDNPDQVWLEHPEQNPFKWAAPASKDDMREALRMFEELIVESQACEVPAMKWFVGVAEGLFPLVRDVVSNRFILLYTGKKGHGKTTGAKSPVLLHGFEDVFMDTSVASLGNIPEQGLVVLDNKEAKNFTQPLIDYFLSIATGGKRLRSVDGGVGVRRNAPRPVAVITSIEGVHKAELHDRCIDVKYLLTADQERLKRGALERAIVEERHRILSALTVVLQEYLTTRLDPAARRIIAFVNPIDSEHFEEVCYLLVAFGRVTRGVDAGDAWAAKLIAEWDAVIRDTRGDDAGDVPVSALEAPVLEMMGGKQSVLFQWQGSPGRLYIVFPGDILSALQRNLALRDLPTEPGQLVQRLESEHFERFVFLTSRTVDADGVPIPELKRRERGQPVGVFVPGD